MFARLMVMVAAIAVGFALEANAELKVTTGKSNAVFIKVASGEQVEPVEAVKASVAGERVLKCTEVEATANANTGNISMKAKK